MDISLDQMQAGIDGLNKDMEYKNFDVPVLYVTGMYDLPRKGTFNLYDSLRVHNKVQRIIIWPMVHNCGFQRFKKWATGNCQNPAMIVWEIKFL